MNFLDFFYECIQGYTNIDRGTKYYELTPDLFINKWASNTIKPTVSYDDFESSLKELFPDDLESLYVLCFYIYTLVCNTFFLKLRPTAKEINDELDKMDEIAGVTFTNKAGKSLCVNTTYLIEEIMKTVRGDDRSNEYETDEFVKIDQISNNLYLQSNFVMNLVFFFNKYYPIKRKKDSLVSVDEQKLILKILYLFKLSPVEVTNSRFRQFKMCFDRFKFCNQLVSLPQRENGQCEYHTVAMLKWKQWKDGKIDFLSSDIEPLSDGSSVKICDY